jgi:hypothetical protein
MFSPLKKGDAKGIAVPPFNKGGTGGIYSHASIRPTTQKQSPLSAGESYLCGTAPVDSPAPKANTRHTILQTKTHRQLHRRFLCVRRGAGCGGGWLTALRRRAYQTRQKQNCILEAAGPTSSALHRPAGFAGAGCRGGGDPSGYRRQKSPLTPLFQGGEHKASLIPSCQRRQFHVARTPICKRGLGRILAVAIIELLLALLGALIPMPGA